MPLQNATATFTQAGFAPSQTIDGVKDTADTGGVGWAIDDPSLGPDHTAAQSIVWETQSDVFDPAGVNLQFSVYAGGFNSHTLGKYRLSYTTADRSTFADGVTNVGSQWTQLAPAAAYSSGNAAYLFLNDNSILMSKQNPNLTTDRVLAKTGPLSAPITGFRLEALEDASFFTNGPGRSSNGNIVVREVSVDTVAATEIPSTVVLQSATAKLSQNGFSVTNAVDGKFPVTSTGGEGWANDGVADGNVATFETQQTIAGGPNTTLTFQLFAGGFSTHTLGKFRISATTAARSLFADGNPNGGSAVGNETSGGESIWTILDPSTITSDNPGTTFSEDGDHIVLAAGSAELETYTLTVPTSLANITGFKLEALTDPSLGAGHGPGNGPNNGNFVLREFTVAASTVPEPSSIAVALLGLGVLRRRRTRH